MRLIFISITFHELPFLSWFFLVGLNYSFHWHLWEFTGSRMPLTSFTYLLICLSLRDWCCINIRLFSLAVSKWHSLTTHCVILKLLHTSSNFKILVYSLIKSPLCFALCLCSLPPWPCTLLLYVISPKSNWFCRWFFKTKTICLRPSKNFGNISGLKLSERWPTWDS